MPRWTPDPAKEESFFVALAEYGDMAKASRAIGVSREWAAHRVRRYPEFAARVTAVKSVKSWERRFLEAFAECGHIGKACSAVGITRGQFKVRRGNSPEFDGEVGRLISSWRAHRRIKYYKFDETFIGPPEPDALTMAIRLKGPDAEALIVKYDRLARKHVYRLERRFPGVDVEPVVYHALYLAACTYKGDPSEFASWFHVKLKGRWRSFRQRYLTQYRRWDRSWLRAVIDYGDACRDDEVG